MIVRKDSAFTVIHELKNRDYKLLKFMNIYSKTEWKAQDTDTKELFDVDSFHVDEKELRASFRTTAGHGYANANFKIPPIVSDFPENFIITENQVFARKKNEHVYNIVNQLKNNDYKLFKKDKAWKVQVGNGPSFKVEPLANFEGDKFKVPISIQAPFSMDDLVY